MSVILKYRSLILVILLALIFRLILAPLAVNNDIIMQAQWGKWIFFHGYLGLFSENVWSVEWPNHPPLITMWYGTSYHVFGEILRVLTKINNLGVSHISFYDNFVRWFASANYMLTEVGYGIIITLKLLPILADLGLGIIIYYLAKLNNSKHALMFAGLFLFLPFSWYLSALYGQTDQLTTLFLFLSVFSLYKRKFLVSPLLLILALDLKPTSLIFVPIYLFILIKSKPNYKKFILGSILGVGIFLYTASLFSSKNVFEFLQNDLFRIMFFTKTPATTISAFNFWFIFNANDHLADSLGLILSYKIWGLIFFGLINIWAIKVFRFNLPRIFLSLFIVGMGGWLFLTNMYERYLFAGIFFGFLVCIYKPKLLYFWIPLSFIYLIDMYHGWWWPDQLEPFENLILWNNWAFARILSIVNIVLFLLMSVKASSLPQKEK